MIAFQQQLFRQQNRQRQPGSRASLRPWCFDPRGMVTVIALLCACLLAAGPGAQCAQAASDEVSVLKDLVYKSTAGLSDYEQVRCKLDLYLPQGKTGFATLVWFHGGALKEGNKDDQFNVRIAKTLANAGLGVAMANYRLSPRAKYPSYVEDAAAAVAWTQKHIAEHGGDPKRVFVGGHSAGGYLTFMIGLDGRYLRQAGSAPGSLAGLIPVSGQTMTHYTIRDERGLPHDTIIADEAAPIHYARKDAPPMLVLYADHDMPARAEENQFLVAALKAAGAKQVTEQMISDRDHGSVAGNIAQPGDPAAQAILAFIDSTASQSASVSTPQGEAAFAGPHFGVNLAGAEFAGDKLPGVFNRNYTYPTAVDLDYFQVRGRTLIRLPFLWERMQHALNGPLDPDELARLRGVLQAAAQRRMHVILDPHSYGRYHLAGEKESQIIGSERVPVEAFADFWTKLAGAVKEEPALYAYALINEPHDMGDAKRWPRAAQAAVNAIRGVDGRTTIIVPGDDWSSARRWQTESNRDLDVKVHDPRTNLVFEAHCYFDKDGSGRYTKSYDAEGGSPDAGVNYVRPFVEWCRAKHVRGFVGEYGVPDSDPRWLVTMEHFLTYLRANGINATYWAAGPWWGKDPLTIQPEGLGAGKTPTDRPQMKVLRQFPG